MSQISAFHAALRADPRFAEMMKEYRRATIGTWKGFRDNPKAEAEWAFASGKMDGEASLVRWLLGYDPADRQSG